MQPSKPPVLGNSWSRGGSGQQLAAHAAVEAIRTGVFMVSRGERPAVSDSCNRRSHQGWDIHGLEGIAASSSRPMQPSRPAGLGLIWTREDSGQQLATNGRRPQPMLQPAAGAAGNATCPRSTRSRGTRRRRLMTNYVTLGGCGARSLNPPSSVAFHLREHEKTNIRGRRWASMGHAERGPDREAIPKGSVE